MSRQPRNFLVIMSDQHRRDAMGCSGHPLVQTPHLDALAAEGVLATNAYCNFPLCGPSRAAFMTGMQPHRNGVLTNDQSLASDLPTFAHSLLAAGYETVLSGRMHFVGWDQRHGFERRLVGDVPESAYIAAGWRLEQVLGCLRDTPGMSLTGLTKSGPGRSGYLAYDETVRARTVAYLQQRDEQRPLLMVVGFAMPHCPFVCEADDFERYYEQLPEPPDQELTDQHPFVAAMRRQWGVLPMPPPDVRRRVEAAYLGMVSHLDRQIGQILAALDEVGMRDDTTVVYTSDHGEQLGDHGLWWKSSFYESSVGVPLIVRAPGVLPAGSTTDANVSLIDIGPTLIDWAAAQPLPGIDGRSLTSVLAGDRSDWCNAVLAENIIGSLPGSPQRMLKQDQWKLIYHHDLPPQLFDLDSDPDELTDLAADPSYAERLAAMLAAALADWQSDELAHQHDLIRRRLGLVAEWIRRTQPAEPDPVWFEAPPENFFDPA